jgi:hypothetical protein
MGRVAMDSCGRALARPGAAGRAEHPTGVLGISQLGPVKEESRRPHCRLRTVTARLQILYWLASAR